MECCFRRTPRVKANMIQSISFACRINFCPIRIIHYRIASHWKNTTFQGTTKECWTSINCKMCTVYPKITKSKTNFFLTISILRRQNCTQTINIRSKFRPKFYTIFPFNRFFYTIFRIRFDPYFCLLYTSPSPRD